MAREHTMAISAQLLTVLVSFNAWKQYILGGFVRGHATKLLRLPYLKGP